MALAPKNTAECDKLLERTHNRYLAAMELLDTLPGDDPQNPSLARVKACGDAAELWIQLHELLDLRLTLPQPRQPTP